MAVAFTEYIKVKQTIKAAEINEFDIERGLEFFVVRDAKTVVYRAVRLNAHHWACTYNPEYFAKEASHHV